MNLAIAIMFALHLASRVGCAKTSHDLLDAGLILVVVSTIVAATPAILQGAGEILIQQRLPLWLVGLAATLSMIERLPESDPVGRANYCERWLSRFTARRKRSQTTLVSPALRNNFPPVRWTELRAEAGMAIRPAALKATGPWFSLHGR